MRETATFRCEICTHSTIKSHFLHFTESSGGGEAACGLRLKPSSHCRHGQDTLSGLVRAGSVN